MIASTQSAALRPVTELPDKAPLSRTRGRNVVVV